MKVMRTLLIQGVLLAAGAGRVLGQEAEGGGGPFAVNPGLSVWTTVIFFALLAILWKYAWGPILESVEKREDSIQSALDEAAERQAEAAALAEDHRRQLAEARREAQDIIAEGREAGERVRREIEEKAREEGQAMLDRARREIERERDAAIDQLRRESVDLALAAASKLLQTKLDDAKDRELVLGYLDDLSEASKGAEA